MATQKVKPPAKLFVSQSVTVEAKPYGGAIRYALGVIDSVHSDGKLPKILASTDDTLADHGFYERDLNNTPRQIVIKPTGRHPELTCLHEIGHFLDHQSLDVAGEWASVSSDSLSGWRTAVEQTQAIQELRSRKQGPFSVSLADGTPLQVFVEQRILDYVLMPIELFARSYAQYITAASQDKVLRVQMAGEINTLEWNVYPLQWTDEDFLPVYDQFELLLGFYWGEAEGMATMTYDQCRTEDEKVQFLMKEYNFSEAEARISCAINANVAKQMGDVRVAEVQKVAEEPASPPKKRSYVTGRRQKATAS